MMNNTTAISVKYNCKRRNKKNYYLLRVGLNDDVVVNVANCSDDGRDYEQQHLY